MPLNFISSDNISSMEPITCKRKLTEIPVADKSLGEVLLHKFSSLDDDKTNQLTVSIKNNLWPSTHLLKMLKSQTVCIVESVDKLPVAWISEDGSIPDTTEKITLDNDSILIQYPWDIVRINEEVIGNLNQNKIDGKVRENVTIDGTLYLGTGSILLPGVYIEGNVIIGNKCKVGPNCYLRGNTLIGDNCHIGQAVEIKNSILMNNVSAGHLTYVGDSVICDSVNFGAATITANFRHDGAIHKSMINGNLIDTGRRKFGSIIGDNVHTGVHTSIYPGRKIWPDLITRPGAVVDKDLH